MTGIPIILPLDTWAENGLQTIFSATTQSAFNSAFDAFFSQKVEIVVNGHHVSREHYKAAIYKVTSNEVSANVQYDKSVLVPADSKDPAAVSPRYLMKTSF